MSEELSKEDLKNEIEELREELKKVKRRKHGEEQQKEVREIKKQAEDAVESNFSRRKFMKALGGGGAALGAAALMPGVAGFDIKSDKGLKYYNQSSSNTNFEVNKKGILTANQIGKSGDRVETGYFDQLNANKIGSETNPSAANVEEQNIIDTQNWPLA